MILAAAGLGTAAKTALLAKGAGALLAETSWKPVAALVALALGVGIVTTAAQQWKPVALAATLPQPPVVLTVNVEQPGAKISPSLYGIMLEEINHGNDGGLYAELIQNRAFQDGVVGRPTGPMGLRTPAHWSLVNEGGAAALVALDTLEGPSATLNKSLRLEIATPIAGQRVGIANEGFWGIPVRPNTEYHASFYAKAGDDFTGPLDVTLESDDGATIHAAGKVDKIEREWKQYSLTLKTSNLALAPSTKNRFVISTTGKGSLWISLVSLFPPTFNNHPNGNRLDLMEKLADLQPGIIRFPGGDDIAGKQPADRFMWKNSVGPLHQRPGHTSSWGYRTTDGMGLCEYFQICEDLKAEPVLAIYAGHSLVPPHDFLGSELEPFVQEALDEIEYVTAPITSQWGAQRAKDGHPQPFKLNYIEIGSNEDNAFARDSYDQRFAAFYDAIKARYPAMQIVSAAPGVVKTRRPDVVDDHYRRASNIVAIGADRYDTFDRAGPKVLAGSWGARDGIPTSNFNGTLADAAFLTGLERNADLVIMSCMSPLFVNLNPNAAQTHNNMIGFDALNSYASSTYYLQQLFNRNRGDTALPITLETGGLTLPDTPPGRGAVGVGAWQSDVSFKDLQVAKADGTVLFSSDFSKGTDGFSLNHGTWRIDEDALHQSAMLDNCRATIGDASWTDCTFTLKARKNEGNEGFLILFHAHDESWVWWNVGGWNNTRAALEQWDNNVKTPLGPSAPIKIETGRWYDVRIELLGQSIKCFLDNNLVTEATYPMQPKPRPLYASASRIDATGEIILKVVNLLPDAHPVQINLKGAGNLQKSATAEVLSGDPRDTHSLADPTKIIPLPVQLDNIAPTFTHDFPASSITVIRLKPK